MAKYILTQEQLEGLKHKLVEGEREGSYMAKQQIYTIAKLAEKMWEKMEEEGDNEQLDDWMESKIAQAEQSINSVVNSFMYDEFTSKESNDGMGRLNFDDLIIGK